MIRVAGAAGRSPLAHCRLRLDAVVFAEPPRTPSPDDVEEPRLERPTRLLCQAMRSVSTEEIDAPVPSALLPTARDARSR